ncbi:hypothetical protein OF377_01370 [Ureaplasma sp. ES3154-GEN]|uniref:hypothetical protein n=1 Tax=Ureaplasma sp. ES3154-GEN TaxID=2984844 RepID=UPI0021E73D90|nr:hypothetical protein [Ureaplasma sp. ES3154-GEN]MCV3743537.1 hypothetical protein [Ureaplasma sp. ES3154-GEN]
MIDRLLNRRLKFVALMDILQNLFLIPLLVVIGFWVSYSSYLNRNFDLNYRDYYSLETMAEINWYNQQLTSLIVMFSLLLILFVFAFSFNLVVITNFLKKYISKVKEEYNQRVRISLYLSYIPILNFVIAIFLLVYYANLNDWNKALNIQSNNYVSAY